MSETKLDESQLLEIRLNYAWDWYKLHANQRATFVRFFLISTSVLVSACITALVKEIPLAAFVASALGAFLTIIFFAFDTRNLHLLRRSIGVLKFLEDRAIYPDDLTGKDGPRLGLLRKDTQERKEDKGQVLKGQGSPWKIKYWLRTLYGLVGAGFILFAIYSLALMRTPESLTLFASLLRSLLIFLILSLP